MLILNVFFYQYCGRNTFRSAIESVIHIFIKRIETNKSENNLHQNVLRKCAAIETSNDYVLPLFTTDI